MNRQLMELLVCPRSKKKLTSADPSTIRKVNETIVAGKCTDLAGNPVTTPLEEGLVQNEEKLLYTIQDGIAVLIYEQAIDISNL